MALFLFRFSVLLEPQHWIERVSKLPLAGTKAFENKCFFGIRTEDEPGGGEARRVVSAASGEWNGDHLSVIVIAALLHAYGVRIACLAPFRHKNLRHP